MYVESKVVVLVIGSLNQHVPSITSFQTPLECIRASNPAEGRPGRAATGLLGSASGTAGGLEDLAVVLGRRLLTGDQESRALAGRARGTRVHILELGPGTAGAALVLASVDAVPLALLVARLADLDGTLSRLAVVVLGLVGGGLGLSRLGLGDEGGGLGGDGHEDTSGAGRG